MPLTYAVNQPPTVDEFIELLDRSTLGERRPIHDRECMAGMIANSNLVVTARDGEQLVGIARSMTDFHYACYLSDLAVHQDYQRQGIGRHLISETLAALKPTCKLILVSAPAANDYYRQLGFESNSRCWVYTNGELRA